MPAEGRPSPTVPALDGSAAWRSDPSCPGPAARPGAGLLLWGSRPCPQNLTTAGRRVSQGQPRGVEGSPVPSVDGTRGQKRPQEAREPKPGGARKNAGAATAGAATAARPDLEGKVSELQGPSGEKRRALSVGWPHCATCRRGRGDRALQTEEPECHPLQAPARGGCTTAVPAVIQRAATASAQVHSPVPAPRGGRGVQLRPRRAPGTLQEEGALVLLPVWAWGVQRSPARPAVCPEGAVPPQPRAQPGPGPRVPRPCPVDAALRPPTVAPTCPWPRPAAQLALPHWAGRGFPQGHPGPGSRDSRPRPQPFLCLGGNQLRPGGPEPSPRAGPLPLLSRGSLLNSRCFLFPGWIQMTTPQAADLRARRIPRPPPFPCS